jgi:hypothetical protein
MVGAEEHLMELDNVWVPQAAVCEQLPLELQVCCQIARELLDCNQLLCDRVLSQDYVAEGTLAKVVQVPVQYMRLVGPCRIHHRAGREGQAADL